MSTAFLGMLNVSYINTKSTMPRNVVDSEKGLIYIDEVLTAMVNVNMDYDEV